MPFEETAEEKKKGHTLRPFFFSILIIVSRLCPSEHPSHHPRRYVLLPLPCRSCLQPAAWHPRSDHQLHPLSNLWLSPPRPLHALCILKLPMLPAHRTTVRPGGSFVEHGYAFNNKSDGPLGSAACYRDAPAGRFDRHAKTNQGAALPEGSSGGRRARFDADRRAHIWMLRIYSDFDCPTVSR